MAKFADVQTILAGRRAITPYPFPGAEGTQVGIKLLAEHEQNAARKAATDFCEEKRVNLLIDPDFFDRALMRFTLLAACFDFDKADRFFPSHDALLELDATVVGQLYILYLTHQDTLDPLKSASAEEVEALAEALGKDSKGAAALLSSYDLRTLRSFALSLVKRQPST